MVLASKRSHKKKAHKMHTTGTRNVDQMFNTALEQFGPKGEDLIRRAYNWFYRGKRKSAQVLKNAIRQFNELHQFAAFVVDYLKAHFQVSTA